MTSSFDYALVRIVPRVERGEFINAGVVLFCRELRFLEARITLDAERLRCLAPWVDPTEVLGHLAVIPLVTAGSPEAGPIGRLDRAGRFHWLVAPRSTIIQTSPVHSGLCSDPAMMLDRIFETLVEIRLPLDEPVE
jgi:Protein of unknown function (DUF3037)